MHHGLEIIDPADPWIGWLFQIMSSIKGKRKKAGWDDNFLLQAIFQANFK